MPEVGQTIAGKYRVVRAIGAGGMGTVVAATHLELGTSLALKFLSDKIRDSAGSVERFTREARACAQLRSEHVCRVTDFGIEDGTPYIAMELLDGLDLSRLIASGKVETGVAADFVMQACSGLAEAHALGIVHRDLKPGNLFLTRRPDGTPLIKVLDFGVAKIPTDGDHSLTKTQHVVGSPGYMAPEQLRSSKSVDRRADVWALGVILYELISARHPFDAEATTEVALKIAMDDPPPLGEAPPELAAVVLRCLAKEPAERFAEVRELAAALAPFSHHDRAASAQALSLLIDAAVARRAAPEPTTAATREGGTAATKVETPRKVPDSTYQHGAGVVDARAVPEPRRRAIWVAGGLLIAGGIAIAGVIATRSEDAPTGETKASAPGRDAAAPADGAAVAVPAQVSLEIEVAGASDGTISVDGVVWGEGRRIASKVSPGRHRIVVRAPGRAEATEDRVIDADTSLTIEIPPVVSTTTVGKDNPYARADRQPRPRPTPPIKPAPSRGSAATPPRDVSPRRPTPTTASGEISEAEARAKVEQVTRVLADRFLIVPDLGIVGGNLNNDLRRHQHAKNWAKVHLAASELISRAESVKIDRALVSSKEAYLSSRIRGIPADDPVHLQILQLRGDAASATQRRDFAEANKILYRALQLVPEARRGRVNPYR